MEDPHAKYYQDAADAQAQDQMDMFPDDPSPDRGGILGVLLIVALALLLVFGAYSQVTAAEPTQARVANAFLCDEYQQLEEITTMATKSGKVSGGSEIFQAYRKTKNKHGVPVCAVLKKPLAYNFTGVVHEFERVIQPDGSYGRMFAAEIEGRTGIKAFMLLSDEVAKNIFKTYAPAGLKL